MDAHAQTDVRADAVAPARVLVVDDDMAILGVVAEVLEDDGYEVCTAGSGEEAVELLKDDTFALVLTDIRLPGMNGISVLQQVKAVNPRTYVIMITSHASMETSINALKLGAYDYLSKPFDDLSLISDAAKRAIDAYNLDINRSQLIRSLQLSNAELSRMNEVFHGLAIRDGLTDLYNHRHINEIMDKEIDRSKIEGTELSLIFVDVDRFKDFNDNNGHQDGDLLLRELSALMRESVRNKDIVARWGGEEFVIVSPRTDEVSANRLAEDLRRIIEKHTFRGMNPQHCRRITISAGVASTDKYRTKAELVEAADAALYRAKSNGRNQVQTAT